jgi:uncharacterized protein (TIGR03083 family)
VNADGPVNREGAHGQAERLDDFAEELGVTDVLAALADVVAAAPAPQARAQLLTAIGRRPRPGVAALPPAEVYARRVAALDDLLGHLDTGDWTAPAAPYAWSVHGLVAHLAMIEEYTARQFGLTAQPPAPATDAANADHLGTGAAEFDVLLAGPPEETVARWRTAAAAVIAHTCSPRFDPAAPTPLHQWPFDASTALVARAFELWTHTDDIRRATGRPLDELAPGELRTMSSTSVEALPVLLALTSVTPLTPTRVVLTGPGGGTFDLGGGPARNLLVADGVEYCRVVSRRLDPADLTGTREGDHVLVATLLTAAQAIAV